MSSGEKRSDDKPVVAFVANSSWYLWNFRRNLAISMAQDGCDVVFIAPHSDYSERLQTLGRYVEHKLDRKSVNPFKELLSLFRLWRIMGIVAPQVVLSWTPKANIYSGLVARLHRFSTTMTPC